MRGFCKKITPLVFCLTLFGLFFAFPSLAQDVIDQAAFQQFATEAGFSAEADIRVIIARIIRSVLTLMGVVLIGYITYGGFLWMTSGGQVEKIAKAKKTIINAIIGIVIIFSSWAITTFVINTLVGAVTGVEAEPGEEEPPGGCPGCPPEYGDSFVVEDYGCAQGELTNMNVVVTVLFSQNVDPNSIEANFKIYKGDDEVEGVYTTGYHSVSFIPSSECADYPGEYCFDANTLYDIQIGAGLQSTGGDLIECGIAQACSSSFTTGELVDLDDPAVSMTDPGDGDNVEAGVPTAMQALATDNGGVNQVLFFVDGDEEDNGVEVDSELLPGIYSGTWESPEQGSHSLYARAYDCAGNSTQSDSIIVDTLPGHCFNEVLDEDETEVDCGGVDCEACPGESCEFDEDCMTGVCENGVCVGYPEIDYVSPTSGAPGNYITIGGEYFGDNEGSVTFLGEDTDGDGEPEGDADDTVAALADCVDSWSDGVVIVEVPAEAVSGPLLLTTAPTENAPEGLSDRTDDYERGALIVDFTVSDVVRPGLCSVDPEGLPGDIVNLEGQNFGQDQDAVYFISANNAYEAGNYGEWLDNSIEATLPPLSEGSYTVQVYVNGEGSNELPFTVLSETEGSNPLISYVDTGLEACEGNSNVYCTDDDSCVGTCDFFSSTCDNDPAVVCGVDDDCNFGSCIGAGDTGAVGQYVTLFGSDFGDDPPGGLVYFTDTAAGGDNLADTDFPEVCPSTWTDTAVTVKVPDVDNGSYFIWLERGDDQAISNEVDFTVIDGVPGPSICAIEPDSGPVGTEIELYGEGFGFDEGNLNFWEGVGATITSWGTQQIAGSVPSGAATGPVEVVADGIPSNPVNFEVADCNLVPGVCDQDEYCCADGTCDDTEPYCEEAEVSSEYVWYFSTGEIPEAPEVVVQCSQDPHIISPTPYTIWEGGDEACVNSLIQASFDDSPEVDPASINTNTVLVQECVGTDTADPCATVSDALEGTISTYDDTFDWTLNAQGIDEPYASGRYKTETWYQVTLLGSGNDDYIQSVDGIPMQDDFVWYFKTRADDIDCEVEDVLVTPNTVTLTAVDEEAVFGAAAVGPYECQLLMDYGYNWDWQADYEGITKTVNQIIDFLPSDPEDDMSTSFAISETEPGNAVSIIAQILGETVFDSGTLWVDFDEPSVVDYWPDCEGACVNSAIGAQFNGQMDLASFDGNYGGTVALYECVDSLCQVGLTWVPINAPNLNANLNELIIEPAQDLSADTYYRVIIEGDDTSTEGVVEGVTSLSGVGMIGLNYGNSFSWVFRTKADATPCGVDSIDVDPGSVFLDYVGQQQMYEAIPYGAPDECARSGQRLTSSDYNWSWDIDLVEGDTQDWEIAFFSPAFLDTGSVLPDGCSSECLNTGSESGLSVCGNSLIEFGEDCDDGNTNDGDMCDSTCLREGFESIANGGPCGNGVVECPWLDALGNQICEECDDGGLCGDDETSCTDDADCVGLGGLCEDETTSCTDDSQCVGIGTGSCSLEYEECTPRGGDGCSRVCTNEGAMIEGIDCGDGIVNHADEGGEECDDGNTLSGDGCSSDCLNEGTPDGSVVFAVCGNGVVEPGEDCDDGNATAGDMCDENCLREEFASVDNGGPCGNGVVECPWLDALGNQICEECDDGANLNGDGCSVGCLNEGASYQYADPSFCGDTIIDNGEECEAVATDGLIDAVQIVEIHENAAQAILDVGDNPIETRVNALETDSGETDFGIVGIDCSCTTDISCGDAAVQGCGTAQCCFSRPGITEFWPLDGEDDTCRNSQIYVQFDQEMDLASFETIIDGDAIDNIALVYLGEDLDGNLIKDADLESCPEGYTAGEIALSNDHPWYVRAWRWVSRKIMGLFGHEVYAQTAVVCFMDGTLEVQNLEAGTRVVFSYSRPLEPYGIYQLVVAADPDTTDDNTTAEYNVGVLSKNGVSLVGDAVISLYGYDDYQLTNFRTGEDVCSLDIVTVEDTDESAGFFTEAGETHVIQATALSVHGPATEPITPIADFYAWEWNWNTSITGDGDVVTVDTALTTDTNNATTATPTINGRESIIAEAEISVDSFFSPPTRYCSTNTNVSCIEDSDCPEFAGGETCIGEVTSGSVQESVFLCENPWPAVGHFPFEDTEEGDSDFQAAVDEALAIGDFGPSVRTDLSSSNFPFSNFSFYYCRDAGEPADTSDDLPALKVVEAPEDPVSADIFREILFIVDGEGYSDAIGVRIASNEKYFSPEMWYDVQGFVGSPIPDELDGYEAAQDGRTIYVNAANQIGEIYPNMYVIAYNEGADNDTVEIYNQILENWRFNANTDEVTGTDVVLDVSLCYEDDTYGALLETDGANVSCSYDAECVTDEAPDAVCGANKDKLRRDLKRLSDMKFMVDAIEDYGDSNRHCSVTKGQSCISDSDCPGDEECVDTVPELATGTFLRGRSYSPWPSWQAQLANLLGIALPNDPLNVLVDCPEDFDDNTCWNGNESEFVCNEGSHVYGYRSVAGEAYELFVDLEYNAAPWAYAFDEEPDDWAEITIGNANTTGNGFNVDQVCDGSTLGVSTECGDGIIGASESCEVGDTSTVSCTAYICENAGEPSYNGVTCEVDADCGVGGSCVLTDGIKTVACCDESGNCASGVVCVDYQTDADSDSECVPYVCGNGVVDPGELCDDGAYNGVYGYCGEDCTFEGGIFCGDGSLSGGEVCDCGYNEDYRLSGSWSSINCDYANGLYSLDPDLGCDFDCSGPPSYCGDAIVDASEECDSENEMWSGKLCSVSDDADMIGEPCESDADCGNNGVCGGIGYDECGSSSICEGGGSDDGTPCVVDSDCDSGICSAYEYDLTRTRICGDFDEGTPCEWQDWISVDSDGDGIDDEECLGAGVCGNGILEGNEECDDGNDSNNDECTNECLFNVCGDAKQYIGVESCDYGVSNGIPCEAPYEGTCNYCTATCQYQTVSGAYCGDGEVNGNEFCDGNESFEPRCFTYGIPGYRALGGICRDDDGDGDMDDDCQDEGYHVCYGDDAIEAANLGYCNGGVGVNNPEYLFNGEPCIDIFTFSSAWGCGTGECVPSSCESDCESACPFSMDETAVLIQSEEEGATAQDSLSLYSYLSGDSPDTALLHFPSCRVGTSLTADVSFENVEDPYIDIVFVVDKSGSMRYNMAGDDDCEDGSCTSRMEIAKAVLENVINELFDSFESGKLRVGLISFESCGDETVDLSLADSDLSDLLTEINLYDDYPYGGTATASGLDLAKSHFTDESSGAEKILVLLSDGAPGQTLSCVEDSTEAFNDALIKSEEIQGEGITIFTAAILSSDQTSNIGRMAHLSSEDCGTDYTDRDDCTSSTGVPYAYNAETEDEFEIMFEAIVDAIRGVSITYTTEGGLISGGTIREGLDVTLPFPEGFECDDENAFTMPFRIEFGGIGPIEISDVKFKYCE